MISAGQRRSCIRTSSRVPGVGEVGADVAHADRLAEGDRVAAGGQAADLGAAGVERLAAPGVGVGGAVDQQGHAFRADAGRLHRRLAVEVLGEIDEAGEVGLERGGVAAELGAEGAVGLLLAQPVLGAGADELEAERLAGLHQPVEEVVLHLDRVVQLPAELAGVGDAERVDRAHQQLDRAGGEPGEALVAESAVAGSASRISAGQQRRARRGPARAKTPYWVVTSWISIVAEVGRACPRRPCAGSRRRRRPRRRRRRDSSRARPMRTMVYSVRVVPASVSA